MANSSTTQYGDDCSLMLHCDGADGSTVFSDSSINANVISTFGNIQIDTAQSVFGGASGLFDGSGDYISAPDTGNLFDFGTGDFTIDARIRFSALVGGSAYMLFVKNISDPQDHFYISYVVDATNITVVIDGNSKTYSFSAAIDTWYHLAVARSSGTVRVFRNGTLAGTAQTQNGSVSSAGKFSIGSNTASGWMAGWMDEIRVVKGQSIWNANFTIPVSAYTDANAAPVGGATRRIFVIT